jgi:RimJ/RimL family protein N-acetyltransferase
MFRESDWDAVFEIFQDEECVRYTIGSTLTRWQSWRTLAGYLGHWSLRGYGPYAATLTSTGETIGPVGLWFPGEWPEPEVKWALARRFWGYGYATEAATAVIAMATTVLRWQRLISLILPANERSKAVARRLGGTYEATTPFRDGAAEIFAYPLRSKLNATAATGGNDSLPLVADARTEFVGDDELESLVRRVYVGEGFTNPEVAASAFTAAAIRQRGRLLFVRDPSDQILLGTVIVVAPGSPACRVAKDSEAEMQLLAVLKDGRKAGIGRALVDAATQLARSEGHSRMVLRTQPTMHGAHRLYARAGFLRVPERDMEDRGRKFLVYEMLL